ncbi:MAG: trehalose-phosphatase, partial [Acetobacterales bacterium]
MTQPHQPPPTPEPGWALFLDVDGTLLEIAATPQAVAVSDRLIDLLATLKRRHGGAVALVSGRPLGQLDALFRPVALPMAGLHGLERRDGEG